MLRAQDVIVAIQLRTYGLAPEDGIAWTFAELARHTGLSASQGHGAVGRLKAASIAHAGTAAPLRISAEALGRLLQHAVPLWLYPEAADTPGAARGIPTAWSAPPLVEIMRGERKVVWPHPEGTGLGESLKPLHHCILTGPGVPGHARYNERLHQVLALVDALRLGRARDRREAMGILVGWGYAR